MSKIRPLELGDLPQVVDLHDAELGTRTGKARPGMAAHFDDLFLSGPWVDATIPSLIYETDNGRIGGFIGSRVRPMMFRDGPIRLACSGPFVTEPRLRTVATLLLRKYLAGAQDLSITDRQTMASQRLFTTVGGQVAHLQCLRWTHIFQPLTFKAEHLVRLESAKWLKPFAEPLARSLDALTPTVKKRSARPDLEEEPLTSRALVDGVRLLAPSFQLYPDYSEAFLDWLFGELQKVKSKGSLQRVLVRDRGGKVHGWYVYYLKPGGLCEVWQIGALKKSTGTVLDSLFRHAERSGAAALRGRVEPFLREPLRHRRCGLHQEACLLVHARNADIVSVINSERAMLSFMEGEFSVNETL